MLSGLEPEDPWNHGGLSQRCAGHQLPPHRGEHGGGLWISDGHQFDFRQLPAAAGLDKRPSVFQTCFYAYSSCMNFRLTAKIDVVETDVKSVEIQRHP